jgi:hypothetical protein
MRPTQVRNLKQWGFSCLFSAAGAIGNASKGRMKEMQKALIIQSNGSGKDKLDALLDDGWTVVSITPNDGNSYNDFLIIVESS